jgi:sugar phosphate isomerase/epimerase
VSAPRIGCNTFIWRSPSSTDSDLDVIDHVADLGGEVVEVAVEDLRLVDGAKVAEAARRRGLGVVVCGAFGPERDVGSADPAVRERTLAYLVGLLGLAVAAGADLVVGPAYGSSASPVRCRPRSVARSATGSWGPCARWPWRRADVVSGSGSNRSTASRPTAGAVCLWREVAPSQDAIAVEGMAYLRALWS